MNILFLCTGNACRSQMAEGWARYLATPEMELVVQSAGIEAHGKNPRAIAAMADAGVDIAGQVSTRVTARMLAEADLLVTVCGHADEHCPVVPPGTAREHWPLEDPARAAGSEQLVTEVFHVSRDEIRVRVQGLLDRLIEQQKAKGAKK